MEVRDNLCVVVEVESQFYWFHFGGSHVLFLDLSPTHALILNLSFSTSGSQFPHLFDDKVGLSHL